MGPIYYFLIWQAKNTGSAIVLFAYLVLFVLMLSYLYFIVLQDEEIICSLLFDSVSLLLIVCTDSGTSVFFKKEAC